MSNDSPAAVIFDSDGYELSVKDNTNIPAGTSTIIMGGSDGYKSRYIAVNTSGQLIVSGDGTAGVPDIGVISVQGVVGGQSLPVSLTSVGSTKVVSQTLENSKVIKTGTGIIFSLGIEIEPSYAGTTIYVEIYDSATVPPNGDSSALTLLGSYRTSHVFNTADTISLSSVKGLAFTAGCSVIITSTRYPTTTIITGGSYGWFNGEIA